MKIVLIGFMGSGKTSVAKQLHNLIQLPLIEMDELVYQRTNAKDMHEVFAMGGDLLLRENEVAIAKDYALKTNLIISTGAGVVQNKITLDYLRKGGAKIFFLDAHFDTLAKRLEGDQTRPLFQNLIEAKKLFDLRLPLYKNYADHTLDVNESTLQEIALQIQKQMQ